MEVGAGLGYWAAALRSAGAVVAACDAAPPGGRGAPNAYHGRVPGISAVRCKECGPAAAAGALHIRACSMRRAERRQVPSLTAPLACKYSTLKHKSSLMFLLLML